MIEGRQGEQEEEQVEAEANADAQAVEEAQSCLQRQRKNLYRHKTKRGGVYPWQLVQVM